MKTSFLVVYDYGTGGVWEIIYAGSHGDITRKYPVLTVVDKRPEWMTKAEYETILSKAFDIDDPPPDWLAIAMKESR